MGPLVGSGQNPASSQASCSSPGLLLQIVLQHFPRQSLALLQAFLLHFRRHFLKECSSLNFSHLIALVRQVASQFSSSGFAETSMALRSNSSRNQREVVAMVSCDVKQTGLGSNLGCSDAVQKSDRIYSRFKQLHICSILYICKVFQTLKVLSLSNAIIQNMPNESWYCGVGSYALVWITH